MKTSHVVLAALCVCAVVAADNSATFRKLSSPVGADEQRYIVKFRHQRIQTAAARSATLRSVSGVQGLADMPAHDSCVVRASREGRIALSNNPDVDYVEADSPVFATGLRASRRAQSGDQYSNWALDYVGDYVNLANPTTVCVIDSGLYTGHEDIPPATGNDRYGLDWDEDECNHGTHVSGTIAAIADNGKGSRGMANLKLHVVRVFDNNCGWIYTSDLIGAMDRCVDSNPDVTVISMSLGGYYRSQSEEDAIDNLVARGITLVAASGNDGDGNNRVSYPAGFPNVISVAAHDDDGDLASFSTRNQFVDIAAPGVRVLSTLGTGSERGSIGDNSDSQYAYYSGTSMATPHVAACVGILKSDVPSASVQDIKDALFSTARDAGASGFDSSFGHGIMDCEAARAALTPPTPPAAPSGVTATASGPYSTTVQWTDNSNNESGFRVRAFVNGNQVASKTAPADAQQLDMDDLPAASTVSFTVASFIGGTESTTAAPSANTVITAPATPDDLTITNIATTSLTVSWEAHPGPEFTLFRDGVDVSGLLPATTVSFDDTGLTPNTEYTYTLQAVDTANGLVSPLSDDEDATTLPLPPAAPTNVQAALEEADELDVIVSWDAQADATSFAIERTVVGTVSPNVDAAFTTTNPTSFKDDTTDANTEYAYAVTAVNRGGSSAATAAAATVTTPEVCEDRDPTVSFPSPVVVDCTTAGGTETVTVAINNQDTSVCPASQFAVAAVVDDDTPVEVSFVNGTELVAATNTLTVTVKTDEYPGETRIYLWNKDSGDLILNERFQDASTEHVFNVDLDADDEYRFKITDSARDGLCCSFGRGFYRLELNGDQIAYGDRFRRQRVHNIDDDELDDSSLTGSYTNPLAIAGAQAGTASLVITVPDAHPEGTTFTVDLFAFRGAYSDVDDADSEGKLTVMCALPDPPADPVVTLAAGADASSSIAVSWTDVSASEYDVQFRVSPAGAWQTAPGSPFSGVLSTEITGLAAQTTYDVSVTARNGNLASNAVVETATTALGSPSAPTIDSVTVTAPGEVTVVWTAGPVAGNAPSSFDVVRVAGVSTMTGSAGAADTSFVDTGLAADTVYTYTVAAVNAAGTAASAPVAVTTTPNAPTGLTVAPEAPSTWSTLRATWTDASSTEGGYVVEFKQSADATWTAAPGNPQAADATTAVLTGLATNTAYDVRVRAVTGALESANAEVTNTATTVEAPLPPMTLTATAANGAVDLAWTLQGTADNAATTLTVQRRTGAGTYADIATTASPADTSFTDAAVDPETEYTYQVVAANAVGSATSNEATVTTPAVCVRRTPIPQQALTVQQLSPATTECSRRIDFKVTLAIISVDAAVCAAVPFDFALTSLPASVQQCLQVTTNTIPDANPSEFSYILRDPNNAATQYGSGGVLANTVEICDSQVEVVLADSFGDGIGNGEFQLLVPGADAVVLPGNFGSSSTTTVQLPTTKSADVAPSAAQTFEFFVSTTGAVTNGQLIPIETAVTQTTEGSFTLPQTSTVAVQCV